MRKNTRWSSLKLPVRMIWKDRQIRLLKHKSAVIRETGWCRIHAGHPKSISFWLQSEPVFRKTGFEKHRIFEKSDQLIFAKPFVCWKNQFCFWFWGSGLIVKLYELFSKPCRDVKHLIRSVLMAVIGPELSAGDFWSTKKLPPLPHTCGPR